MIRLLSYLLLVVSVIYLLSIWGRRQQGSAPPQPGTKQRGWLRGKRNPMEPWVQVYETASADEGRMIQARLQEEEVECILYEQGKKDIHGNVLPGIGIAVPKSGLTRAQNVISRLPV